VREITFQVRAPELHLSDNLAQVSRKILAGATSTLPVRVDEATATLFRPHLESDWGSIYSALPDFFNQFVRGRWQGNDQQHLPTTLVGDFGEFLTACLLRRMGARRVARVLRASDLNRPDFVAYFPARHEVLAIEVKAGSLNASTVEEATWKARRARRKHQLNICSALRKRREDGIDQITGTTGAPGRQRPPAGHPWNLGRARVPAHRTAVATPYFIDGRLSQAGVPWDVHSKPKACGGVRCRDCVLPGARNPLPVLLPIFYNSKVILSPLRPPDDFEGYVDAHALAARAVWTGSESLFHSAWQRFVTLFSSGAARQREEDQAVASHLLDVLAAGVEAGVVPSAQPLLKEASITGSLFDSLVEEQLAEAEPKSQGTEGTPRGRPDAAPRERWEQFWRARPQRRPRSRLKLPGGKLDGGTPIRDWVEKTKSELLVKEATLELPGATVFWIPTNRDEQAEFRIAAETPALARQAADALLALLIEGRKGAQRFEQRLEGDAGTHTSVLDGALLVAEALIGAEGTAIVRGSR
jgi:hypothetical protein